MTFFTSLLTESKNQEIQRQKRQRYSTVLMWLNLFIQFFCLSCRRGEISEQIYNFINGEFVPPEDGRSADTLNPSTGEALCKYPLSGVMDLEKAVEAASSAFKLWSKVSKVTI